jgi:hypothetical protein
VIWESCDRRADFRGGDGRKSSPAHRGVFGVLNGGGGGVVARIDAILASAISQLPGQSDNGMELIRDQEIEGSV